MGSRFPGHSERMLCPWSGSDLRGSPGAAGSAGPGRSRWRVALLRCAELPLALMASCGCPGQEDEGLRPRDQTRGETRGRCGVVSVGPAGPRGRRALTAWRMWAYVRLVLHPHI